MHQHSIVPAGNSRIAVFKFKKNKGYQKALVAEGFEKIVRNNESKGKQKDWVKLSVREAFVIE